MSLTRSLLWRKLPSFQQLILLCTIQQNWVKRLADHREEAVKVSNEVIYRTWRLYRLAFLYGFKSGNINVNQTLLAKVMRVGKSNVPFSRADLYS
jgi:cyclopropane-fatty-acyl-phospholipid synthase